MSGLSGCPVRAVTCTNSPDNSERSCPYCPGIDGCNTPEQVLQPIGEADVSMGVGAGGDFRSDLRRERAGAWNFPYFVQVHRLPDSPEAYGAMITRPKAAPTQSRSADLSFHRGTGKRDSKCLSVSFKNATRTSRKEFLNHLRLPSAVVAIPET